MIQNVAPFYPKVRKMEFHFEGWRNAIHQVVLRSFTRRAIQIADCVVALSKSTKDLIEKDSGKTGIDYLYHGRDLDFSSEAPIPLGMPAKPFFLFVSSIYVYKGLEYLIEALCTFPELPPVVIIGKVFEPGYFNAMMELAERKGVKDRLIFVGDVKYRELPGWYAHALGLVFPSWCENCPNILIEAMTCGCPIVAMQTGPMPDICGEAAFYSKPFDGISLGEAMAKCSETSQNRRAKEMCLLRAQYFTWEEHCRKLLEFFEKARAKAC